MQKMQRLNGIGEKELKILQFFYQQKTGYVRQIKNALKLPEHTLLKYLCSLEKQKILASHRKGNLKIYEVNLQSPFVRVFFSYFDLQRVEALEYTRKKAVKEFIHSLKQIKIPYFVLLFGSTAKKSHTLKSDIDLIIIYDAYNKKINQQIRDADKKILAETGLKISCILMKLSEFIKEVENKENYALQDAIKYGYPVFGNQLYYEVLFK